MIKIKKAEDRVKVIESEGETRVGFIELDGEFLESIYNDKINRKVADQIIKAINDTVEMCCNEFMLECPHGCINCFEVIKRSRAIMTLMGIKDGKK